MKRTREVHKLIETATDLLAWDYYPEEAYKEAREYLEKQYIPNPHTAEDRSTNALITAIIGHWTALERLER